VKLRWYGQSAFLLDGEQHRVFIDPFGDVGGAAPARSGWSWPFPQIEGVEADVLLVTHDHLDHNGVEAIGGDPLVLDRAGTHESPIGEVVGIASEHDAVAGTQRGPNTIFRFSLDGTTFAHFGDFGQQGLRPEQREALGTSMCSYSLSAVGRQSKRAQRPSSYARSSLPSWWRCTTARPEAWTSSTLPKRSSKRSERRSNSSRQAK
jgi:Beta-lactamase superfamily domain